MHIIVINLQVNQLATVTESVTGVGTCPYDPHNNNTALLTHSGGYLCGPQKWTYIGRDPAIYRIIGPSPKLRTVRRNLKWLNGKNVFHIQSHSVFSLRNLGYKINSTNEGWERRLMISCVLIRNKFIPSIYRCVLILYTSF